MKIKNLKTILFLAVMFAVFFEADAVLAVCPVCTVAVGAGLGFSRWLGINDAITGLWIGGLLVSVSWWTIDWLEKKKIRFWARNIIITAAYYGLTLSSLYYAKIIAHPLDFLSSCVKDNLLLGIIEGSAAFLFAVVLYEYLKEKNHGRAHFPYEKVILPVGVLAIFSIIFYYLTK